MFENRQRTEAGVLAAGRPCQETKWLNAASAFDDVDPIANLQTADEREYLVRGQVEGMDAS